MYISIILACYIQQFKFMSIGPMCQDNGENLKPFKIYFDRNSQFAFSITANPEPLKGKVSKEKLFKYCQQIINTVL